MRPVEESDFTAGHAGRPGVRAVVPRPGLFELLRTSARVTALSAPAGSGKTTLLRSWISEAGLGERVAWVSAQRGESDPQQFWLPVLSALRQTAPGSALVRELTAAPDLDGWAIVERLLKDLAPLGDRVWLVVDDVHELGLGDVLRQLELLVLRAPPELRIVLAARRDMRLGLHRLRLEGELTEIRPADLRFTVAEARALFQEAGVRLSGPALGLLHERTEGWAAGLRLAALSLAGHPDPERFAAEFSGSERTVAEYLLAEVLERQPEEVRRLLLRTSVLGRVSGPLADALTGGTGGERVLLELEAANAFVVPVDAARTWFRYHHLFADLLQLELRRTAPDEGAALHRAAAQWLGDHAYPVEAVRHAQAAGDWAWASRLLADHWPGLQLDGQVATVHALLAGFPAEVRAADAELAVLGAADEPAAGSLAEAERTWRRQHEAVLRLAQGDPHAATAVLAPVLSRAVPVPPATWLAHAYLLEAVARDALGDPAATGDAMRRALKITKLDNALMAFLFHPPSRELLDRYAPGSSEHAAPAAEIRGLLPEEPGPGNHGRSCPRLAGSPRLVDPLSQGEVRVLRYLPTNLSAPEIARELSVSVTTVRTHIHHLFLKLGAHRRTEAVALARDLGLLAPSPGQRG